MKILLWHQHGSWTDAFVRGRHEYLLPVTPDRDEDGLGRAGRPWPSTMDVHSGQLRETAVDLVILQREKELLLAEDWLGRRPGIDVPAVYVEHNTPRGDVPDTRHHLADRDDIPLVHVTGFNQLLWDSGRAPALVIEHGLPDPGRRFRGTLPRAAAAINEPARRWRVTGTDLLAGFVRAGVPVDVFGIATAGLADRLGLPAHLAGTAGGAGGAGDAGGAGGTAGAAGTGGAAGAVGAVGQAGDLGECGDLSLPALHDALALRRCYLHPCRWTSLGLALIEAMLLGLPVVAVGSTEAYEAVPPDAGVVSTRLDRLLGAARDYVADPDLAAAVGARARAAALRRYGLDRFLADWDRLLEEVVR